MRYIASALRGANIPFALQDAHAWGTSKETVFEEVKSIGAHLFGVQLTFSEQIDDCKNIVDYIRKCHPESTIVLGGHLPTFTPEYFLNNWPSLTCVACGEAEETIVHLAKYSINPSFSQLDKIPGIVYLQNGQIRRTSPPITQDIDLIAPPYRDPRDHEVYGLASVITSRGCFYRCSFCSVPQFNLNNSGLKFRSRSVISVANEIEELLNNYDVTHISFIDDIFLTKSDNSRRRIHDICSEFRNRQLHFLFSIECRSDGVSHDALKLLKEAGLSRVFLGLESASEEVLRYFQKDLSVGEHQSALTVLDELQIPTALGVILFNPIATPANVFETLSFLENFGRLRPKHLRNKMMVYPGTPIYNQMIDRRGNMQAEKPVPIQYNMNNDAEQLRVILLTLSRMWSNIDTELDRAEFRIASLQGEEYSQKYCEFRSVERRVSNVILGLSETSYKEGAVTSSEEEMNRIIAMIERI